MRIVAVFMAAGLASIARLYAQLPHPVSLEEVGVGSVPGVRFEGIDPNDYASENSGVGDVNGDGYADFLIGASGGDPGGLNNVGEAYLLYGARSGLGTGGVLSLSTLDGSSGALLEGFRQDWYFGYNRGAGDVNGDGLADFMIAAPGCGYTSCAISGEAYLVHGSALGVGDSGALNLAALDGTNGIRVPGLNSKDRCGSSISGAGDINGDGFADILIGASLASNESPSSTGEAYLIYGSAGGIGSGSAYDLASLDGATGVLFTRGTDGGLVGYSVSGAGDVNGDGLADFLVAAQNAPPTAGTNGQTFLIYGTTAEIGSGGRLDLLTLSGSDGVRIDGRVNDYSGNSVSSAGDVNGDGFDDILIGAYEGSLEGRTYLVYGSPSGIGAAGVLDLAALDGTNGVQINGILAQDYSGARVAGAGDVNADGYSDFLIGAISEGGWRANSGEVYLIYGSATGIGSGGILNLADLDGANGVRLKAIDDGDNAYTISGAGDSNGDGYMDFLVGAGTADILVGSEGEVYLIYGSGTRPPGHRAFIAPGNPGRRGIGLIDGSNNIPASRVWLDFEAGDNGGGGSASAEVILTPQVTTSLGPLVVSPEYEWEISTTRTGYGSAEVIFKGFGTAGEIDWQALILKTDDAGASWYAPPAQIVNSLLHEITLPGQVFPGRYALVTASDVGSPEVVDAVFNDANDSGVADAGEVLTLVFDRGVIVRPAQLSQASFSLPVSGDSLGGGGFAVAGNAENSRFVDIILGASPTLTVPGAFGPTTPGSPSGIDIASGLLPTAIQSLVGRPAAPSAPTDIDFTLKTKSTLIPTSGGTATVTTSTDAAYTGHALVIPSGALSSPTTFTLQPPPNSGGQINAVQIVSSPGGVTFSTPATLTLEYRDSDIDTERGQREASMRIHQLVENPIGTFAFRTVPGTQAVDTGANAVSVDIDDLNPAGSAGEVGIFAILPGETIERALFHIRPEATGAPVRMASDPGSVVLQVGTHGLYTEHWIEIPGYEFTTPTDPARTTVRLSSPTLFDRVSTVGGQSFPTASGSLLVVETWNAAGEPIAFTDPVTVRVEFRDDDLVDFAGGAGGLTNMRLVRDTIDGPMVHFAFIPDDGHALGTLPGGGWTERSGITDLTGPSGRGVWGAVANLAVPVELSVFRQE